MFLALARLHGASEDGRTLAVAANKGADSVTTTLGAIADNADDDDEDDANDADDDANDDADDDDDDAAEGDGAGSVTTDTRAEDNLAEDVPVGVVEGRDVGVAESGADEGVEAELWCCCCTPSLRPLGLGLKEGLSAFNEQWQELEVSVGIEGD